ncbi:MAG: glycoside hydrolase family 5 protein [Lachnospiraceae bacterium]
MKKKCLKRRFLTGALTLSLIAGCTGIHSIPSYAEGDDVNTVTQTEVVTTAQENITEDATEVTTEVTTSTEETSTDTTSEEATLSAEELEEDLEELVTASQIACNYTLTGNTANYKCTYTPVAMHGKLSVSGTNIVDASGNVVQLRGVSLHGIQHTNGSTTAFKDYVNLSAFQILRDEWGVNLIRIPVYTAEGGYCQGNSASMDTTIQNAVSYANQLGMYVMIDWHILSDGNPQTYQSQAVSFFNKYASMYKNYNNVIYEICNEPNNVSWSSVKSYAVTVIKTIRAVNPDALIVVGNPDWSQLPHYNSDNVSDNPITNANLYGGSDNSLAKNVLYSIHFYASTHYGNIQSNVTYAHNKGLPIFCTEFGICDASGNGNYDINNANSWMNLLKSYNISFCCWNLSNNNESSAMFLPGCTKLNSWTNADLNTTGAWFINTVRPMYEAELANANPNVYNGVDYSSVYDYDYYISKYSDLKNVFGGNKSKAIAHFVNYGMKEGRQGCANFNVTYYKNRYVDLRNSCGKNLPLYYKHYMTSGKKEGRDGKTACTSIIGQVTKLNGVDYSAVYNYSYYLNKYSDLKKVFNNDDIGALTHFVNYGMKEGRQGCANFNVTSYAYKYYDLRKVFKNDKQKYYLHYIKSGKKEGRIAIGTTTMQGGPVSYSGVNYSAVFNVGYYANKYADLRKAFGFDDDAYLKHFVNSGMNEGRQGSTNFNVVNYKNRYKDLQKIFGNDLKKYYIHYINYGKKEGRNGK